MCTWQASSKHVVGQLFGHCLWSSVWSFAWSLFVVVCLVIVCGHCLLVAGGRNSVCHCLTNVLLAALRFNALL